MLEAQSVYMCCLDVVGLVVVPLLMLRLSESLCDVIDFLVPASSVLCVTLFEFFAHVLLLLLQFFSLCCVCVPIVLVICATFLELFRIVS